MDNDDIQLDDDACPKCGHEPTHHARCDNCHDGRIEDLYERDPMWYDPGDWEPCDHCDGRGFHHWCPKCGYDMAEDPERLRSEEQGEGTSDV